MSLLLFPSQEKYVNFNYETQVKVKAKYVSIKVKSPRVWCPAGHYMGLDESDLPSSQGLVTFHCLGCFHCRGNVL